MLFVSLKLILLWPATIVLNIHLPLAIPSRSLISHGCSLGVHYAEIGHLIKASELSTNFASFSF